MSVRRVVALVLLVVAGQSCARPSVCYGTPANGRLEHGVRLPLDGTNFTAYSTLGWTMGRTAVHDRVRAAAVA